MLIRTRVLPKALYGSEVSTPHDHTIQALITAIAKCLTIKSAARSTDLTFSLASYGEDLDPWSHITMRRTVAFRRNIAKNNKLEDATHTNDISQRHGYRGTFSYQSDNSDEAQHERHMKPTFATRGRLGFVYSQSVQSTPSLTNTRTSTNRAKQHTSMPYSHLATTSKHTSWR